jgi:uncharacterized membrane protein
MSANKKTSPDIIRHEHWFYLVLLAFAAGYVLSIVLDLIAVRVLLGLALVGYVPGALLIRLLFSTSGKLIGVERVVLSVVFSLVLCAGVGLLLNILPGGLRPTSVGLVVWGLVLCLILLNIFVDRREPGSRIPDGQHKVQVSHPVKTTLPKSELLPYIASAVAAICCVALLAYLIFGAENGERYTEFYALSQDGIADSSLAALPVGDVTGFLMGISNRTGAAQSYHIEIVSAERVLFRSDEIMVEAGDAKQVPVSLQLSDETAGTSLEARLYLTGETDALHVLILRVAE